MTTIVQMDAETLKAAIREVVDERVSQLEAKLLGAARILYPVLPRRFDTLLWVDVEVALLDL